MRRVAVGVLVLGLAGAGFVSASVLAGTTPNSAGTDTTTTGTGSTDSTTETTATTQTSPAPPPPPRPKPKPKPAPAPDRLPARVTVGGVQVGGLTPEAAADVVRLSFRSPLALTLDGRRLTVSPARFGAKAYVAPAIARALQARPGRAVRLVVTVRGSDVRSYVAALARKHDRQMRDAQVVLNGHLPAIVDERVGLTLRQPKTVALIVRALYRNRRGPLPVPVRLVQPEVRAESFTEIVVIRRAAKQLLYFRGERLVRTFTVATGQAAYPTPLGSFHIIAMWRDPWWYPPPSPWAQGAKPIPPGPGNPLGTRWMGISAPSVGIHGTPDAASLGYSASHGCIRMAIPSAEWLFAHVKVGTPVLITDA